MIKYNNIDFNIKDKFYESFIEQIESLKNNIDIDFEIIAEDVIDKVILQNIDVNLNYDKLISEFVKILNKVIETNINKTYIIFYNSQIFSLNIKFDNCYIFDFNPFLEVNEYNILITNDYYNLNYKYLIDYLKQVWPIEYDDDEIEKYLIEYFKIGIQNKVYKTNKEKLYLTATIINKVYNIGQEITCDRLVFDSIIKSFIDNT